MSNFLPVSASAIMGRPDDMATSFMILQKPSNVTKLNFWILYFIICVFYPISGTPLDAVTAAPEMYKALNPIA